jgi:hypothetical protein
MVALGVTSFVTTAPAPTSAPAPTRTPPNTTAPDPTETPRATTVRKQLPVGVVLQRPGDARGTRVLVVYEPRAVSHEHLIVDLNAFADERVALDLAARADRRAALDLDEWPYAALGTDPAPVQVREGRDLRSGPDVHVGEQTIGRRGERGRRPRAGHSDHLPYRGRAVGMPCEHRFVAPWAVAFRDRHTRMRAYVGPRDDLSLSHHQRTTIDGALSSRRTWFSLIGADGNGPRCASCGAKWALGSRLRPRVATRDRRAF